MQMFREPRGLLARAAADEPVRRARAVPAGVRRIVGQMQHDLFHVYTVDEHILMVIRNLRRFTEAQHAHEYPLCSRLIADFERRKLLYVARLFHDIAKGRGGDHSALGARDARRFCRSTACARTTASSSPGSSRSISCDVVDRAEAGPVRSRRDRAVRAQGRHERRLTRCIC
jgi:hypothetical protein